MRRYAITMGAATDSGGRVTSASSRMSVAGAPIALEGDRVFCPVCKSEGKIVCDGPRVPESWMGRQIALQDDLCACACPKHPRLIASQTLKCQVIESGAPTAAPSEGRQSQTVSGGSTFASNQSLAGTGGASQEFDECFRLTAADGHTPLVDRPYRIIASSGQTWEGRTDAEGLTLRVSTPEMANLTIEVLPD